MLIYLKKLFNQIFLDLTRVQISALAHYPSFSNGTVTYGYYVRPRYVTY